MTFQTLIQDAVERRSLANCFGRASILSFATLHHTQREALIKALIEENEAVLDLIQSEINCALEETMDALQRGLEEAEYEDAGIERPRVQSMHSIHSIYNSSL